MQSNRKGVLGAAFCGVRKRFQFLLFMLCYFPPLTVLRFSCWNIHTFTWGAKQEREDKRKMSKQNYFSFSLLAVSFHSNASASLSGNSKWIMMSLVCELLQTLLLRIVSNKYLCQSCYNIECRWMMALSRHLSAALNYCLLVFYGKVFDILARSHSVNALQANNVHNVLPALQFNFRETVPHWK